MAVMRHSIQFGNVDSADYGIYISGEGVFDAPERDVEMVEIPGRNGTLAIDRGRYQNIEVKYPAFNYEPNYDDFAQNLADFRNALCSQRGYQRLTDSFHPDEYRYAMFRDGLEIEPIKYNTASEFDLVFDCKPQRFLNSGNVVQTFTESGSITNPTKETALPLLRIQGTGTVTIMDRSFTITDTPVGDFLIKQAQESSSSPVNVSFSSAADKMNVGDEITVHGVQYRFSLQSVKRITVNGVTRFANITQITAGSVTAGAKVVTDIDGHYANAYMVLGDLTFANKPTSQSTQTYGTTLTVKLEDNTTASVALSVSVKQFRASEYKGRLQFYSSAESMDTSVVYAPVFASPTYVGEIRGNSSMSILGNYTYIDCEEGECYKLESNLAVSVNEAVSFENGQLPHLYGGFNSITLGSGITQLRITPRWWQV